MHVDRLNRDQRTKPGGMLNNILGYEPGIDDPVVRINQNSFTAIGLAPARDIDDMVQVLAGTVIAGLWAG
jgi:hypothetical protein